MRRSPPVFGESTTVRQGSYPELSLLIDVTIIFTKSVRTDRAGPVVDLGIDFCIALTAMPPSSDRGGPSRVFNRLESVGIMLLVSIGLRVRLIVFARAEIVGILLLVNIVVSHRRRSLNRAARFALCVAAVGAGFLV